MAGHDLRLQLRPGHELAAARAWPRSVETAAWVAAGAVAAAPWGEPLEDAATGAAEHPTPLEHCLSHLVVEGQMEGWGMMGVVGTC